MVKYVETDVVGSVTLPSKITIKNEELRGKWRSAFYWLLNFHHEEAVAQFSEVAEADPGCPMALWGRAYALGSNYNFPPGLGSGFADIQKALTTLDGVTTLEGDLITALATRWDEDSTKSINVAKMAMGNSPKLNLAYAEAMKGLYEKYPDSLDIAAFYAESLMNLKPWELWTTDGKPADDNTVRLVGVLEAHLAQEGGLQHPALCHLYCHAMELSPTPEKACAAADSLRGLVKEAGHLLHMPSHIDAWTGQYEEGLLANEVAVKADDAYVSATGCESNFYKFYRCHNMHFAVWMACFEGRYEKALEYARLVQKVTPPGVDGVEFVLGGAIPLGALFLESYHPLRWHVWIRFGKWEELLAEPVPEDPSIYPVSVATAYYARGIAYASTNRVKEAEEMRILFHESLKNPKLEGVLLHNVPFTPTDGKVGASEVASKMLDGEIAYRKGEFNEAFAALREAVQLDASLPYDEPWGWMVPSRHALGALLLEQGHTKEAEEVYRADLKQYKDNMWGLLGLRDCLLAQGRNDEAKQVDELFQKKSARSDTTAKHTCFCAGVSK
mmetsp:Transcript_4715/g.13207  ORF Transcript_4715/g.13207 Transcript_4715/m.13207 type:complete len:557 (+) Transcript_4715:66-1736(+)